VFSRITHCINITQQSKRHETARLAPEKMQDIARVITDYLACIKKDFLPNKLMLRSTGEVYLDLEANVETVQLIANALSRVYEKSTHNVSLRLTTVGKLTLHLTGTDPAVIEQMKMMTVKTSHRKPVAGLFSP
jgi:Na+/phosphate symporter